MLIDRKGTGPSQAQFTVAPPGFRLPGDLILGPVRLQVADLSRSVDYYRRVLGLRVLTSDGTRGTLAAAGDDVALVELNELPNATPVPRRGRLGLYHYALLLPDRTHLGRLLAHLGRLGEYAGMADHLVSEALYLTDPDGLGIEVYADRPRSTWRMDGGALAMASDPLDVDDLVAAGGDQPWSGMPAGTSMGHVHLYVADLDQAAGFYHAGLGLDRILLRFPGALFLSAGGYHHHLGTNTWAAGAPVPTEGDARLLEWTIRLPGRSHVGGAAASLAAAGHAIRSDGPDLIATDPWDTSVRLTAADSH